MSLRPRIVWRRFRTTLRYARGLEPHTGQTTKQPTARLGSEYGGWDIHPETLNRDSIVYCFGAGTDVSFDLALIKRFGVTVHVFDPSPRSIAYLKEQALPPQFIFHDHGLADHDGVLTLYPPTNPNHVSFTCEAATDQCVKGNDLPVYRLSTVMKQLGHQRIDLLKMDIEGAEYGVIKDILDQQIPIHQLLVEFHHHMGDIHKHDTDHAIEQLNQHGYHAFAISPTRREYSFIQVQAPVHA